MARERARYIVIIGCGRLGSLLANRLSSDGDSVVVIDSSDHAFRRLSPAFSGFRIEADGAELAVLRAAKVAQADLVLAITGDDSTNLMAAQLAREILGAARVIARIGSPARKGLYERLGIDVICPLTLASEALLEWAAAGPDGERGEGAA